jgi:hypothetical protein
VQAITHPIEREEGLLDYLSNTPLAKPASAQTSIQHLVSDALRMSRLTYFEQSLVGQAVGESERQELATSWESKCGR